MSLDTKLFIGGDIAPATISYITDGSTLISRSDDYDWDVGEFRTMEGALSDEDEVAAFRVKNLIEVLTTLRDEIESEYVKVRLTDDKPIHFLTKDNDRKLLASIAPARKDSWKRSRLDPIEANLLGYHVYCTERDDCDWVHDRYRLKEDAVKAAEDHRYFTGHKCKIRDYDGNQVDFSKTNGEEEVDA